MPSKPQKQSRYVWPPEAERLVKKALRDPEKKPNALLLHSHLEQLTAFSSDACWRFLQRHGIQRPGSGTRKVWSDETMIEFVMEHGYAQAAQKFNCSRKALYSAMQRQGRTLGHCSGQYGLNQLRRLLNVRLDTLRCWINMGRLEATPVLFGGKPTFVISNDQLRRFLTRESGNLLIRRFPEKRVEFLSEYLFCENHMNVGLPRTRESKKENDAYREHELRKAVELEKAAELQSALSSD